MLSNEDLDELAKCIRPDALNELGISRQLPDGVPAEEWEAVRTRLDVQDAITAAAGTGSTGVLQWLCSMRLGVNSTACTEAARSGHIGALSLLRQQEPPFPWDERACAAAAGGGHLHALQWLRAQDPPCLWDESVRAVAAGEGHRDVLQWLRAQDLDDA
jgi:hypothetical protein